MDSYLEKGEFFELYSCWVGEETEKREGEIILQINKFDINQIEIPEKTLVRFEKWTQIIKLTGHHSVISTWINVLNQTGALLLYGAGNSSISSATKGAG